MKEGFSWLERFWFPFFLAIVMAITYPTLLPYESQAESSNQCCFNNGSGDHKPINPFPSPSAKKPITRVDYNLAPYLDIELSEDEGEEPDGKKGRGGHQTQPSKPPFHRS